MSLLRQAVWVGIAFAAIGVGLLGSALWQFTETKTFVGAAAESVGEVIDLEFRSGSVKSGGGYVTVFRFQDAAGAVHVARTSNAQNPPTHRPGARVAVLYLPASPSAARIRGFRTLWLVPTFLGLMGLMFAVGGGGAVVAARRALRDATPAD